MEAVISGLLKDFEDGKMTRRQLIQSLAMAAAAVAPGGALLAAQAPAAKAAPIPAAFEKAPWKTVWLDHISYAVSDKSYHVTDPDGWDLQISNQTRDTRG